MSLRPIIRSAADDRFLADDELRRKVNESLPVGDVPIDDYDLIYLAGGWGAAFDFATSEELGDAVTAAAAANLVIGGICHGPLGLVNALAPNGSPLVHGRKISAVTDKQVRELGISLTPFHPETELRKRGADFESEHRFRDPFANHWVVDGNLVTGQNQNAGPMVAQEMMRQVTARQATPSTEKETTA
jgi:putative intracellular protease/amidase